MEQLAAKSPEASRLRQNRSQIARKFEIPQALIGGSLSVTRRICGKTNCHCASGNGHPQWTLSWSNQGERHVEKLPVDWVESVEQAVLNTQEFLDAIKQVMAINMKLLAMTKQQRRQEKVRQRTKRPPPMWKNWRKRSTFSTADRSLPMWRTR